MWSAFCGRETIINDSIRTFDVTNRLVSSSEIVSHLLPVAIVGILALWGAKLPHNHHLVIFVYAAVTGSFGIIKAIFDASKLLFFAASLHNIVELYILLIYQRITRRFFFVVSGLLLLLALLPLKIQGFATQQLGLIVDLIFFQAALLSYRNNRENEQYLCSLLGVSLHVFFQIYPLIVSGVTGGSHYFVTEALIAASLPATIVLLYFGRLSRDLGQIDFNLSRDLVTNLRGPVLIGLLTFAGFALFMVRINTCDINQTYKAINLFELENDGPDAQKLFAVLAENARACSLQDGCLKYDVFQDFDKHQIWTYEEFNSNQTLWAHFNRAAQQLGGLKQIRNTFGRNIQPMQAFDQAIQDTHPALNQSRFNIPAH